MSFAIYGDFGPLIPFPYSSDQLNSIDPWKFQGLQESPKIDEPLKVPRNSISPNSAINAEISPDKVQKLIQVFEKRKNPRKTKKAKLEPDFTQIIKSEKNRFSAQMARDRHKAYVKNLEERNAQLEEENACLKKENEELKKIVNLFKNTIEQSFPSSISTPLVFN